MDELVFNTVLNYANQPRDKAEVNAFNESVTRSYAALARNGDFHRIMEDMTLNILLRPCDSPEEEGERRLVLKMLKATRESNRWLEQQGG